MWPLILATALALPGDTVTVRPGDVLVLEGATGEVFVQGVESDRAEIVQGQEGWTLERVRNRIEVHHTSDREPDGPLHLVLPRDTRLRVGGDEVELVIEGVVGGIDVSLLSGDVTLHDVGGAVRVDTFSGDIVLVDAEGGVSLTSLEGSIEATAVRGDLHIDTTDGDLKLRDVSGGQIHARTVDGDVEFEGEIGPGGSLTLATHDGDVTARVPSDIAASVEISTFDGNFESAFPVRVNGLASNRGLQFDVGGGGSRVVLRSFDGDIRLIHR